MSNLPARLRDAADWVHHQDMPAPDWDALLAEAADAIDDLTCICDLIDNGLRAACPNHP